MPANAKVNVPNILKNILNVIIQFTPAPLDEATFYIRLLWGLRSQNDLSITMGALFLTNYLDGISYLFTSKFFFVYSFLSILLSVSV